MSWAATVRGTISKVGERWVVEEWPGCSFPTRSDAELALKELDELEPVEKLKRRLFREFPKGHRPWAIATWYRCGSITASQLRELLPIAWRDSEFPWLAPFVSKARWIELFKATGFLSDTAGVTEPPREGLTVYRGCLPRYRLGLAWTTDIERAQWFANRFPHLGEALVYRAHVGPRSILAMFNDRKESEVIVNPRGLKDIQVR